MNDWLVVIDWLIVFFLAEINITHLALSTRGFTGQCPYHQLSLLSIHIFLSIYVFLSIHVFLSVYLCIYLFDLALMQHQRCYRLVSMSVDVSSVYLGMSFCSSVCVTLFVYHWQVNQAVLSIYVYLSVCLPVWVCLSLTGADISRMVNQAVLSVCLCLIVCLSVCLSVSIYLSACLTLFIIDRSRHQQYGESGSPV